MLHDSLKNLSEYPFHMPGHKRNPDFNIIGSEIDITEINGFDNLHSPKGLIAETEKRLSMLYNSEHSFMLINGSTVGILSAIFAVSEKGNKIIIARNCHKSVYNACFMMELDVACIEPEYDFENGFYTYITQEKIDKAIEDNPDAAAVVITSPTYEGYISNVKSPVPLIIDSAHGAHFGFGKFPSYQTADIVISSLHKTLPSLTQTAVLNIYNKDYISGVKMYLDILQTSSPSYVLMNSVSVCAQFLENSEEAFEAYEKNLDDFYKTELHHLSFIKTDDKSKIVVSTAKTYINGTELADILRKKFNIECEMASINYIILMSSVADTKEAFSSLSNALTYTDRKLTETEKDIILKPAIPKRIFKISEVKKTSQCEFKKSAGKVCGEYIYAYPPDIPIITPGELISEKLISNINKMIKNNVNIISDSNLLPSYILTKAD